jgi:hypothetical protein
MVTGRGGTLGGGGKLQRIIVSSRSPSRAVRTIGAIASGNTLGIGGRFPVRSACTAKSWRIASWFVVIE